MLLFDCCSSALETIEKFAETLDVTEYASRIMHPLVRTLDTTAELRPSAMNTLCTVVQQLNRRYVMFIPMVAQVLTKHHIQHHRYEMLISQLMKVG
jgi:serine/threonine-protein kinase mTOR